MTRKRHSREPLRLTPTTSSPTEEVVQLPAVACNGCGRRAAAHVRRLSGVAEAAFDPIEGHLRVQYDDGRVDGKAILGAISASGVDAEARRIVIPLASPVTTAAHAEAIERILMRLAGVVSAHADPISRTVTVTYATGVTGATELKAALGNAGFLDSSTKAGKGPDRGHPVWKLVFAITASLLMTLISLPFPWGSLESVRLGLDKAIAIPAVPFSPLEIQVSIAVFLLLQTIYVTRNGARRSFSAARAGVIDEGSIHLFVVYGMAGLAIAMLVRTGNGFIQFLEASWLLSLFALDDIAVAGLLRKLQDDRTTARESLVEARARRTERRTALFAAVAALAGGILVYQLLSDVSAAVACALSVLVSVPLFTLFAAAPAAMASITGSGVSFRDSNDQQRVATAREVILLDGAIRDSDPVVSDFVLLEGTTQESLLQVAAGATGDSQRPVARALRRRAGAPVEGSESPFREIDGIGWEGEHGTFAGFAELLEKKGIATSAVEEELARFRSAGKIVVLIAKERVLIGAVALDQTPAVDAARMVADLRREGMTTRLLTTQESQASSVIAKTLGIDAVDSEPRSERLWKAVTARGAKTIVVCSPEELVTVESAAGVVVSLGAAPGASARAAAGDRAAIALVSSMARRALRTGRSGTRLAIGFSMLLTLAAISWPFALGFDPPPILFAAIASILGWSILSRCARAGTVSR